MSEAPDHLSIHLLKKDEDGSAVTVPHVDAAVPPSYKGHEEVPVAEEKEKQ